MKKIEYNCHECANQDTPLCTICHYITNKEGKVLHKPTYFLGSDLWGDKMIDAPITESSRKVGLLVYNVVLECMNRGKPIPLKTVLEYNKAVEMTYKPIE